MAFREIQIRSYDFKYTLSKERIVWCKNVYNSLSKLLPIVNIIKWNSYVYNGVCSILETDINESEENENEKKFERIMASTTPNNNEDPVPLNYKIFGGSTYELFNKKHYKTVNLRDFMDPTGDADIKITLPLVYIENANSSIMYTIPLIDPDTQELNDYFRKTFQWCYEKVYEQLILHDLNKLFPNSVPFNIDEYGEVLNEFKHPNLGFYDMVIGNCHLISFNNPKSGFFKIQLVIKIADDGITKIDHLMEFLFEVGEYNEIVYYPNIITDVKNIEYLDEYRIDSIDFLFVGNIEAYAFRQEFLIQKTPTHYHKAFNHILRIIYLLELSIHVGEYEKYKITFFKSLIKRFTSDNFINRVLFPEKIKEQEEQKQDPNKILEELHKNIKNTARNKHIYDNLYIYFYKVGSHNKMKLIKINVSDFLEMYHYKLSPQTSRNVFSGELIKKDETNRKYKVFMKRIKENVKNVRTRKFHRSHSVSSVKSEGPASSRRQKTPEMQVDSGESELYSFSYMPNIAPPPSRASSRASSPKYIRSTRRKNKSSPKIKPLHKIKPFVINSLQENINNKSM